MLSSRVPLALTLSLALVSVIQSTDLPRQAPNFTIQMPTGKPLRLSQYKGKAVVLAFILTSCPHCQKAVGLLSKDQVELSARGLQVLAVAVEDGAAAHLPGFVRTFNPSFPVGYSADYEAIYSFMQHPRNAVPHMPMLAFIDKAGMIRAQYEGTDAFLEEKVIEGNLRKGIEDLLRGVHTSHSSLRAPTPVAPALLPAASILISTR